MGFHPLYLSRVGKGKSPCVGWASYRPISKEIDEATAGAFYVRCVLGLVGRPLD